MPRYKLTLDPEQVLTYSNAEALFEQGPSAAPTSSPACTQPPQGNNYDAPPKQPSPKRPRLESLNTPFVAPLPNAPAAAPPAAIPANTPHPPAPFLPFIPLPILPDPPAVAPAPPAPTPGLVTAPVKRRKAGSQQPGSSDGGSGSGRIRHICKHPGCGKQGRQSKEHGTYDYCRMHMKAHNLTPREADVQAVCKFAGGCVKAAVQCKQGGREYCVEHMRLLGLEPNFIICTHPDCGKKAQPSIQGVRQFCNAHMRLHGLTPKVGDSRKCRVEGCDKTVQAAVEGGKYCLRHARELGVGLCAKAQATLICKEEGCSKHAYPSVEMGRRYCCSHLRAKGLTPKLRMCQHPGCDRRAECSLQGPKSEFCHAHMALHGLQPRPAQKKAKKGAGGGGAAGAGQAGEVQVGGS